MRRFGQTTFALCGMLILVGCSHSSHSRPELLTREVLQEPVRTAPGVVEYVWEEPMVDVIEVPSGLDPEGMYWRPAHQSVVEIRQGRWKYYNKK
ncbi:MAG: hypothetical protein KDD60_09110 [Bdellovibrionales bacterium]|nr:hypothetical protein [Bdellovibrionales bacterium]